MTACTAVYEVGTPSDVSGASGRTVSPSYVGLKEGYEKAYFEDPFHIDVNDVWTHISWVSGASCVGSPSGYGSFNWLSYDGWTKVYGNTYSQNNCGNYEIWSNAQFANPSFPGCSTYSTAYTTYSGVSAEGFNDGTLYGWVDGMTSSVVNGVCPPLSAHQQLVQTYP